MSEFMFNFEGLRRMKLAGLTIINSKGSSFAIILLTIQFFLLTYKASIESFVWDEVAHLPSGLSHLELGNFDLYRVNPPLVRSFAAIGPSVVGYETDWNRFSSLPESRAEFIVGRDFVMKNGKRSFRLLFIARFCVLWIIPFGGWVAWNWSRQLFGELGGAITVVVWTFSPSLLANGSLITPDASSASMALIAMFNFSIWLRKLTWRAATISGIALGVALLTKTTLTILVPITLTISFARIFFGHANFGATDYSGVGETHAPSRKNTMGQVLFSHLLSLFVLNLGYGFEGTFQELGEYEFISRTFTGEQLPAERFLVIKGNRFKEMALAPLPMPVPRNWLMGVDVQKWDFECRPYSFLAGEWRRGGWWYYYLCGFLIKEPVGTIILIAIAFTGLVFGLVIFPKSRSPFELSCLLAPASAILIIVSSQTGMNHHLRYVLPALPFCYVLCGACGGLFSHRKLKAKMLPVSLCIWIVWSSLKVYPHSIAYFNEFVGGPAHGHKFLHNSNIDWGQDLLNFRKWVEDNPHCQPLYFKYVLPLIDFEIVGIVANEFPTDAQLLQEIGKARKSSNIMSPTDNNEPILKPGWFAISVSSVNAPRPNYEWLKNFSPDIRIGWSIWIYCLSEEEIEQVETRMWQTLDADPNH